MFKSCISDEKELSNIDETLILLRADWDSFFRENKEMNEMKAGERPDTIKLENMPCKWWDNLWILAALETDFTGFFVYHFMKSCTVFALWSPEL